MSTAPMSAIGEAALIGREGVRTKAYLDSVGIWTIGVGHTAGAGAPIPRAGMTITVAEAMAIFRRDILVYAAAVDKGCGNTKLEDHQRDALCSFIYNVGVGYAFGRKQASVFKAIQKGELDKVPGLLMRFTKPKEITSRRKAEANQFEIPYNVSMPKARSDDRNFIKVKNNVIARATPTIKNPVVDPLRPSVITGALADLRNKLFGKAPNVTVAYTMPPGFNGDPMTGNIQAALRAKGFTEVGTLDGVLGKDTRQAIRNIIRNNGDDPDKSPHLFKMAQSTLSYIEAAQSKSTDGREAATFTAVKQAVPEVTRPLNTLTGIATGSVGLGGLMTVVQQAQETINSVKNTAEAANSTIVELAPAVSFLAKGVGIIQAYPNLFMIAAGLAIFVVVGGQAANIVQLFRAKRIN